MIDIVVGTSHVSAILGYDRIFGYNERDRMHTELRQSLRPLIGQPIFPPCSRDDLAKITVFDALTKFHEKASEYLSNPPANVLAKRQRELQSVARDDYHYPEFEATLEDACRSLATHGPFPHGRLIHDAQKTDVFLPDFTVALLCDTSASSSSRQAQATGRSIERPKSALRFWTV